MPPPDVLAGLCGSEVRQQTGLHLLGLRHRLHCLHLCRSAGLRLQTATIPVSVDWFIPKILRRPNLFAWLIGFSIHRVCMLGNRTISGHEIDDSKCAKFIQLQIKEPERVETNFTITNGRSVSSALSLTTVSFIFYFFTYCIPPVRKRHCGPDLWPQPSSCSGEWDYKHLEAFLWRPRAQRLLWQILQFQQFLWDCRDPRSGQWGHFR